MTEPSAALFDAAVTFTTLLSLASNNTHKNQALLGHENALRDVRYLVGSGQHQQDYKL